MPRGEIAEVGTERVSQNGYTWVKTAHRGWVQKHWLIAEKGLHREVIKGQEMVKFKDGDRSNLDPSNLEVVVIRGTSESQKLRQRLVELENQIASLKAMPDRILNMIEGVVQQMEEVRGLIEELDEQKL